MSQNVITLIGSLLSYAERFATMNNEPREGDCWGAIKKARALMAAAPGQNEDLKEKVMDAIGEALGGAYDCLRVWSAWGVGTMSQDDFALVAEDSDRLAEIADAAIAAVDDKLGQALLAQPVPLDSAVVLLEEADSYLREIRAENLDGSEPELGKLLERVTDFWVAQNAEPAASEEAVEKSEPMATHEIVVSVSEDFVPEEGDAFDAVVAALDFAEIPTYVVQRTVPHGVVLARKFMSELLDSVETLGGIAQTHGQRTLADLMYLQQAIMNGGVIDHYPGESEVVGLVSALPSGTQWVSFIKVEEPDS